MKVSMVVLQKFLNDMRSWEAYSGIKPTAVIMDSAMAQCLISAAIEFCGPLVKSKPSTNIPIIYGVRIFRSPTAGLQVFGGTPEEYIEKKFPEVDGQQILWECKD